MFADDWEGIYINDQLVEEGHHISAFQLCQILNKYTVNKAERIELSKDGIEWLQEEVGSLPKYFQDIPYEYLT